MDTAGTINSLYALPAIKQTAQEAAWNAFKLFYREQELLTWKDKAETQKKKFIRNHIDPLANLHVTWMGSNRLRHVMRCQYHELDRNEGYVDVVGRCIANTQGWQPCRQSYVNWLKDGQGVNNPKNLVLRALACNDRAILGKVKAAQGIALDMNKLALDGWVRDFEAFDKLAKQSTKTDGKRLANLISELQGPLTERMAECFDRGLGDPVCALLTASAGGKRMLGAKLELPALDVARYIDNHIWSANPGSNLAQRLKATEVELIRAGIWDPKTGYTEKVTSNWYILERPGDAYKINTRRGLDTAVIESEEGLKALSQEKWQKATSGGVRWALVAGIFQTINLSKLIRDYHNAKGDAKAAAGFQLTVGCTGMACAAADISGKFLKNLPDHHLYMGRDLGAMGTKYMGESITKWAARVSIGLAVVAALPDVLKGIEELDQGYKKRFAATEVSAVTGIGAVAFVTWECPLVGAVCLMLFIGSNIYLAATKKVKMREWLRRCSFGVGSEDNPPYTTMESELDGLSFAFETDVKNAILAQ